MYLRGSSIFKKWAPLLYGHQKYTNIMERVDTLLKKLQNQFTQNASVEQLLLTVQMLQAELLHLQHQNQAVLNSEMAAVNVSPLNSFIHEPIPIQSIIEGIKVERTVEMLQVDEAELDAELEEIKRNAKHMQSISVQHKPHIIFEPEEDIPTLKHTSKPLPETKKQMVVTEINESVAVNIVSLNDKLKQSKIDLGDTLTEAPIKDLRKAIALNDQFLFINELFRGDEIAYERSIKTINSFSIFAEAEYWIQRELMVKNGWRADNEMVAQFYQLVKRRFS